MYKISDFKIPYLILRLAAQLNRESFINLNIKFNDSKDASFDGDCILLGRRDRLQDTFWGIIVNYLNNWERLYKKSPWKSQEQKIKTFSEINKLFLKIFDPNKVESTGLEEPTIQRLYQHALVWNILETVICPAFKLKLENKQIILARSPYVDISGCYQEKDFKNKNDSIEYPFIFLNDYCIYEPVFLVHLIVSFLECIGECPVKIINEIWKNKSIYNIIEGMSKVYFLDDSEHNDFMNYLFIVADINIMAIDSLTQCSIKEAQKLDPEAIQGNWWYMGLYEKMLEPARGPDINVHDSLESLRKEIDQKIRKRRNKKGRDGLTYESLLRIKNEEVKPDNYMVLEKLLSQDRIW